MTSRHHYILPLICALLHTYPCSLVGLLSVMYVCVIVCWTLVGVQCSYYVYFMCLAALVRNKLYILHSLVQVVMAPFVFFSYLKCQHELCQKLQKFVELCQSYA